MIEENIVNHLNLCDSMQLIDSYTKKKWLNVFKFFHAITSHNSTSIVFSYIANIFSYGQLICLALQMVNVENDIVLFIIKAFSNLFLFNQVIHNQMTYTISLIVIGCLLVIILILIALIVLLRQFNNKIEALFDFCVSLINLINLFLPNYLIGPIVYISLSITYCNESSMHVYLNIQCYSHWKHITLLVLSLFYIIFYILYSMVISFYCIEIGSLSTMKSTLKLNCNYDSYLLIAKTLLFIYAYILNLFHASNGFVLRIINEVLIIITTIVFSKYARASLLFYDNRLNNCMSYSWNITLWIVFTIFIKDVLSIDNASLFLLIGLLLAIIAIFFVKQERVTLKVLGLNIFNSKDLKAIESFTSSLIKKMTSKNREDKIILTGVIQRYEEIIMSTMPPVLISQYQDMISTNDYLRQRYQMEMPIKVLAIITLIYESHLVKSKLKTDIMLIYGYFIINYLNNIVYCLNLCSKIKLTKHKELYLKYVLMEEIKEKELQKLNRDIDINSIQHIQISSVIIYNHYIEDMKVKIYDAASSQVDYFDLIKNKTVAAIPHNVSIAFLNLSKNVMAIRSMIISLWNKITDLNPFCDDVYRDYMLYLEVIMQDIDFFKEEAKEYFNKKASKQKERTSRYYSLFDKHIASVLLIDGYSTNKGKVLYGSPSFNALYGYFPKEILNLTIEDLVPNAIKPFHQEIANATIQHPKTMQVYACQMDLLLKNKEGGISKVKIWLKVLPNMTYGLIFILYLSKQHSNHHQDNSEMIIALADDFRVTDISEVNNQWNSNHNINTINNNKILVTLNSNYGIRQSIFGYHIGIILPDLLLNIKYIDQKFTLKKKEMELKGKLFPICNYKEIISKMNQILDLIKQIGAISTIEIPDNIKEEYNGFVKELKGQCSNSYSVYYKIIERSFAKGKYSYYRIDLCSNVISLVEEIQLGSEMNIDNNNPNIRDNRENNALMIKQTKSKKNYSSKKYIKTKVSLNSINYHHHQKYIGDGNDNGNNTPNENKHLLDKEKNEDKEKDHIDFSNHNKDLLSNHLISKHSSQFLSIKAKIIQNKQIIPFIKILNLLSFYFVITCILAIGHYSVQQTHFHHMTVYLNNNHFFDHSKILSSCIYMLTINLKMLKHQFITQDFCRNPCHILYLYLLTEHNEQLKIIKDDTYDILPEFEQILTKAANVTIIISELGDTKKFSTTMKTLINMIITTGFRFIGNFKEYYFGSSGRIDYIADNLVNQIWVYISDMTNNGLNVTMKEIDLKKGEYDQNMVPLVINFFVMLIVLGFLFWYVYVVNRTESMFINRLINFNDANFDLYLKRIEELKKRLKNDPSDENDNNNDNDEERDGEEKSNSQIESKTYRSKPLTNTKETTKETFTAINKNKKDKDRNRDKTNHQSKSKKQKERHKLNKIQHFKNEKIKALTSYFFKQNIWFLLRIIISILLTWVFYALFYYLHKISKKNYIDIDNIMSNIEAIYKSTYIMFLILKQETRLYFHYELNKEKGIEAFNNGETSYTIGNKTFSSIEELVNSYYKMKEFNSTQRAIPKMGNQVLPLMKDPDLNKEIVLKLSQLYNGNGCVLILKDKDEQLGCEKFWSGILTKGVEQSLVQMGVIYDGALKDIVDVNKKSKDFKELFIATGSIFNLEYFLHYYLSYAYRTSSNLFTELKALRLNKMKRLFMSVFIGSLVWFIILYLLLLYFIFSSKKTTTTFFHFIVIIPHQYLSTDDVLYKEIIKLSNGFF